MKKMTAQRFRSLLKTADIGIAQFGRWLDFDRVSVSRWANGRSPVPRYIAVLAELLAKYPEVAEEARSSAPVKGSA